ncbi:MAG: hypothetical protein L0227_11940 [Chloroflexi bacterium]|nr:hypothetical protein [Chloroflexota bacterium]
MVTRGASRELVLVAGATILVSRFVDGPVAWAVGGCLLVAVALASLQVLGEGEGPAATAGVPVEALAVPAVAAFAVLGAIRLVPVGLLLAPALLVGTWLIARVFATEARILGASTGPSGADRTAILVWSLVVGFLAFTGIAALVPGGLPEPGTVAGPAPTGPELAALAAADATVAFLLGYRASALRSSNLRDVAWFGLTSAIVIAIAAVALRAMEIPRLLGPALLVLVFFLWDAVHGAPPARRRDPRRIWETVLLVVLGIVVVAWSLRLRT